jgi:hypothetical protein
MRLPDGDVDEDVGVEGGHRLDGAVVLAGHDTMEHRSVEAIARRVGVDPLERSHPRLVFEQTRYTRPEFTTHAAHEDPYASHR